VDILDQKGWVGRITYVYNGNESVSLVHRSTRSGMGYLTEKAFMSNLKARVKSLVERGIDVTKVEKVEAATVVITSELVEPKDLL